MRISAAAAAVSIAILGMSGISAATSTDVLQIPTSLVIRPSAKALIQSCVGELVSFEGTSLLVAHQTYLSDGSLRLDMIHFNGQGSTAIGLSTGRTYRVIGADTNTVVFAPDTLSASFEANLLVIGPGAARDFQAHILQHITITPDGSISALIDVADIECR